METCPKCGFSLTEGALDCPRCGIILAKFRPTQEETPAHGAEPPADGATTGNPEVYSGEAPSFAAGPGAVYGAGAVAISRPTIDSLSSARPWLNFLGGYLMVISALMVLGAVALVVLDPGGGELGAFSLVYMFEAALVLVLAMPLKRSGKALENLSTRNVAPAVEEFAEAQASFWRRAGWITLISLILAILGATAAIMAGILLS